MGRFRRRRRNLRAVSGSRAKQEPPRPVGLFANSAQRRILLAGTALVSTLAVAMPSPASAQAIIIVSNSSINFTRNSDCVFVGTCLSAVTIRFISPGASIKLTNNGDLASFGILSSTIVTNTFNNNNSPITIKNTGDLATAGFGAVGIYSYTGGNTSPINITNSGGLATRGYNADAIYGLTTGRNSNLSIINSGDLLTRGVEAEGIYATTKGANSALTVVNSGKITTKGAAADGIDAFAYGRNNNVVVVNSGDITTTGFYTAGIVAGTSNVSSPLTIRNSGKVHANGALGYGIVGQTFAPSSPVQIENSGDVFGSSVGILTFSLTSTTINNSGSISAGSRRAIDTVGAGTTIHNTGLITGFVDLTDSRDTFENQSGGEFNASDTSDFGGGGDVFTNKAGSTLRVATQPTNGELTSFVGLERFENKGLITMVDGRDDDVFRISNTVGGINNTFVGSGDSTFAVDAFLGGPGSTSDRMIIDGNVTGRTRITVNNTNSSSARFDPVGIPVVFAEGNVNASNFYIDKPIDAGFFEYDLFFKPTGSGFWELKNHTGGGSHLLPHLVTVTHDTFHNTTETWFDQSTDLRVLLAQGDVCSDPARAQDLVRCQQLANFTPGVWARGAGTWLELQDDATTQANGRTYHHDLDRDLDIWLIESGFDFGKRDLLTDGDILVFGVLGGAVESTLDYKGIDRRFVVDGLEAGAYATYLKGGFFVDTLFKTIFAEIDPKDVRGFPDTLDSTTYGLRSDTGYRFGGLRQGPFLEPLATIAVSWTHVDDFALDGNAVDFNDDENVRGRVGFRVGTSTDVWGGTTFEPFVVGSLWGTLSGDHTATLTSTGRDFEFTDEPEDLWGVVSAGVNFFNPSAQTAVFAKVDYTFADQTQGIGVRGGMRYNW